MALYLVYSIAYSLPAARMLSGVFGSISLTAWICLLIPQLLANYRRGSAEALSLLFLVIWLLGDMLNLAGALLTDLAPSGIAIGVSFIISDLTLISQCLYYNTELSKASHSQRKAAEASAAAKMVAAATSPPKPPRPGQSREALVNNRRLSRTRPVPVHIHRSPPSTDSEDTPLLSRRYSSASSRPARTRMITTSEAMISVTSETHTIVGGSAGNESDDNDLPPNKIDVGTDFSWWQNALGLLLVYVIGAGVWLVTFLVGAWDSSRSGGGVTPFPEPGDTARTVGMALGYTSAVFYLCARLPQIIRNYHLKSCDGLSPLFFLLSVTGNLMYGLSLIAYKPTATEMLKDLPWLIGSLGTIVQDCFIFVQFRIYAKGRTTPVGA